MPGSVQPIARVPAWRVVIIGIVGLLAVGIGIAAGSFLLATRTAAVGAGSAYVPADVPFYVEMRLEPSVAQDGALRELLSRFPTVEGVDLDQPLYPQLTARLDEMLAGEDAGVSWAEDVAPWFDGHAAVAVTDIPAEALAPVDPMAVPSVPGFVVFLGVTDVVAADAGIDRLVAASPEAVTLTELDHGGVTIHVAEGTEAGAYAITDDQVLVAANADDIIAALDLRAAGNGALAQTTEMASLTDALPADWLMYVTYDLTDVLAQSLAASAETDPAAAAAFEDLLANQSLRGAMAVSASGERLLMDVAADPPTADFALVNDERSLAAEVPADALYYAEGGNLGPGLSAFVASIKAAIAATPDGANGISAAEGALGEDLEELVSWIGDGALVIGADGAEPYAGMLLVPTDVDQAQRRLGQLVTFARLAASDPSLGITVEESDVAGTTVTTFRWESGAGAPDVMMPTPTGAVVQLAITDERVIIGFGESFVGRVLELDPADGLAAQPRYAGAIAELGGASNVAVGWFDVMGTREAIELAAAPMLEMIDPDGMYESDIRPWLLPLDRLASVTRVDGEAVITRSALFVE